MCGRYTLSKSKEELEKYFQAEMLAPFQPRYNAAPTQLLPLITGAQRKGFSFFYWGITPDFAKNKPVAEKLINARGETVQEKVSFRKGFQQRRCIIPADGFYEWKRVGKKTKIPYRFTLEDGGLFAFAGIWEEYETTSGESRHTFLIITCSPNALVEEVHDRMPVILDREAQQRWLDPYSSAQTLQDCLQPFSAERMLSYPVSPMVNHAAQDHPSMIRRTDPMDQFGNYTLFG
ncbi:hypothetical protein A3SI_14399 [Nitritalea halalkaliphila LW7]|uniref:Abasic site processing protein n=1 Tax=Nitritalea halalkaliphila LW7 TaxID=1189621 RepID=I5BZV4_9BACT|nr:SOS response-associated peptidase [Nitritalea halalkaliphila]EIM75106.1 hypothetical protein A3SI_14399 [Nitritalea halalkaliphila LW7]